MQIVKQDGDMLLCVKPAGVAAQGEAGMEGLLRAQTGGAVFPVHRLDQAAAGLMLFAKTPAAAAALSRQVREGTVDKEYLALVSGMPDPPAGRMEDLLYHDARRNKTFPVTSPRRGVRRAALTYRTLATQNGVSLVRAALETGRTHQIRVQFASRGMPLLGDGKYGSRIKGELALWSCALAFEHPKTGERLRVFLPPEGEVWRAWKEWGEQG